MIHKVTKVTYKNVNMVSAHFLLRTIDHRAFKFHMQIGIGEDMTAIDVVFTRSKGNVTIIPFVKGGFRSFS